MKILNSFEELLELYSLEGDRLKTAGSSLVNSNRKRGIILLPLTPRQGKSQRVAKLSYSGDGTEIASSILWEFLFGDPRVYQWFFLFELLNSIKTYDLAAQSLYDILFLVNVDSKNLGPQEKEFMRNMKSVRQSRPDGLQIAKEIAEVLRRSGIKIPFKRDGKSLNLKVSFQEFNFKESPEVRRIGVGYKDKGSLPPPGSEYDPEPLSLVSHCPIKLWSRFRNFSEKKYTKSIKT